MYAHALNLWKGKQWFTRGRNRSESVAKYYSTDGDWKSKQTLVRRNDEKC